MLWKFQIVTFLFKCWFLVYLAFFFFKQAINEARLKLKTLSHLRQVSQVKVQPFHLSGLPGVWPARAQSFQTRARASMEAGLHFYQSLSFVAFSAHTLEQAVVPSFVPVPLGEEVSKLVACFSFTAQGAFSGQHQKDSTVSALIRSSEFWHSPQTARSSAFSETAT